LYRIGKDQRNTKARKGENAMEFDALFLLISCFRVCVQGP
jgi:hypothetical protein